MRKHLLSIMLLALLSVANVHGASSEQFSYEERGPELSDKIKFGTRVGTSYSFWLPNKAFAEALDFLNLSPDIKTGVRLDLYGEYALTDALGIDLTVMYTKKGSKYTLSSSPSSAVANSFDYFALASSLRMYPGQDRQFCIFLGPYIGYLVRAKAQEYEKNKKLGGSLDLLDKSLKEGDKPNRFDFGTVFGMDYEFGNGVLLGGNFDVGFLSVIKEDKNISQKLEQPTAKNVSLRAFIGYNFAKLLT